MKVQQSLLALAFFGPLACMPPGSGDAEATTDADTGGEPICGDGKLDSSEACDDGNIRPGDGCSASCELSGTPTQCITLMRGKGMLDDQINVVLPLTDSFVAGGSLNVDGEIVAWVGEWSDQGDPSWVTTLASEDGETRLRDVTTDGSNGWWVALTTSGVAELAHLDENGNVVGQTSYPDASLRKLRWIGGRLWAAGSFQK